MYLDFHPVYTECTFVNIHAPTCCYWECGFTISGDMHTQVTRKPRSTVIKFSLSMVDSQHGRSHFVQIVYITLLLQVFVRNISGWGQMIIVCAVK